jgi:hypothetical protein
LMLKTIQTACDALHPKSAFTSRKDNLEDFYACNRQKGLRWS